MIEFFDVADVNKAASAFNPEKLLWLNQQHMIRTDPSLVVPFLQQHLLRIGITDFSGVSLEKIIVAQRERCKTVKDMATASRFFFGSTIEMDPKAVEKHLTGDALALMENLSSRLEALSEWTVESIHSVVTATATELGLSLGKIAQPLRVAVTGSTVSPPIDQTLAILGRVRTLARIHTVLT
jgi:glutamyl-tRNA synthetase